MAAIANAGHSAGDYGPVLVLILMVMGFVAAVMALTHLVGPRRRGPLKEETYEAGMPVIGDARGRFNARFYVVAMVFLLFDVEIVLLWPWVMAFYDSAVSGRSLDTAAGSTDAGFMAAAVGVFFLTLLAGYVYDWGKGVFRWE